MKLYINTCSHSGSSSSSSPASSNVVASSEKAHSSMSTHEFKPRMCLSLSNLLKKVLALKNLSTVLISQYSMWKWYSYLNPAKHVHTTRPSNTEHFCSHRPSEQGLVEDDTHLFKIATTNMFQLPSSYTHCFCTSRVLMCSPDNNSSCCNQSNAHRPRILHYGVYTVLAHATIFLPYTYVRTLHLYLVVMTFSEGHSKVSGDNTGATALPSTTLSTGTRYPSGLSASHTESNMLVAISNDMPNAFLIIF